MPGYDFELVLSRPLFEPELDPFFQRTHGDVTVAFVRGGPDPAMPDDPGHPGHPGHHTGNPGPAAKTHPTPDRRPGHAGCSWHAASLATAVIEVIEHVEISAPGLRVLKVETDPLVSMRAIAERIGRSVESVRLSISGARGPGGFPAAETTVQPGSPRARSAPGGHRLWRWSQVATWYGIEGPQIHEAEPTAQAINAWLTLREIVPEVAPAPEDLAAALSAVVQNVA